MKDATMRSAPSPNTSAGIVMTRLEHKAAGLPKGVHIALEPGALAVAFEKFESPDQAYALSDALTALAQQCRTIAQRLNIRTALKDEGASSNGDRNRTAKWACEALSCSKDWLYENAEKYGFLVKLGTRARRFSEKKILEWIATGGHV